MGVYLGIFIAGCIIAFFILDRLYPVPLQRLNYSAVITSSDSTIMSAFLSKDDKWRMKISYDEIPPDLQKAFLFKEDKYFYYHPGINLISVCRAAYQDISAGKIVSGASTITMQVARMLSPEPRTIFSKIKEMFRAFQLEYHFSKKQILMLYFNLLPYGGNIEGIKAASLIYFHKMPVNLSLAQVATLMVIPNDPNRFLIGQNNGEIIKERNQWLKRFGKAHLFPEKSIRQALSEPLKAYRHNVQITAPQLSISLANANENKSEIYTYINKNIQDRTQKIVKNYIHTWLRWNVSNAAVIIVRNSDRAVITYVGSANFYDAAHHGQVDGADAIRSPGSTLKPFLYAMAFDQGLITPKSILYDVPTNFNGYAPEDYDRTFHGKVTAQYALLNSLNVPAVRLLNDMDFTTFEQMLENGGCHTLSKQRDKLGLSLILGGCGIKLKELVGLYAALANKGEYKPLRRTKNQPKVAGSILFSPEAAFMVSHILTKIGRFGVAANIQNATDFPRIAWKTGTSYGHHDGWCVGYDNKYTVGVWTGNFDGTVSPELSGATCAVPLMTKIFNTLDKHNDYNWLKFPKNLAVRYVCANTGNVPSRWCTNQVLDYYIPNVSSTKICNCTKLVYTDAKEKYSYNKGCLPKSGYVKKLYPNYPPDLITYFDLYHIPYEKIPPLSPDCHRIYTGKSLTINSPSDGMNYVLMKDESKKIMLKCSAGNDVSKVYWYINDKFYGEAKPDESLFFTPNEGKVKVSCTDDKGRTANAYIYVKMI